MARIAFFTLNAYDMLTGGAEGEAVGGAQLQQILVGKELATRGHEVYFVEYDTDVKKETEIDGIHVVTKPLPVGSELSRAATVIRGTKRILDRIDPDICYRRVLNFEIVPLSVACHLTDRQFVYGVAHDTELTDNPDIFAGGFKNSRLYRPVNQWALSNADAIITQNRIQYERASERHSTDIFQIPNCYPNEPSSPIDWEFDPPVVFWAARFKPWKRPDIVVDLAEQLPDINFVMAGGSGDEELFAEIKKRSDNLENIHVLGHIPIAEIDRYFAAADLFLNTSDAEGFPNTFLQAWANKVPVASLQVDPSDILSSEGIGIFADGSVASLRDQISDTIHDAEQITELGEKSQQYLNENHTVETITDEYEKVFLQ